MPKAEPSELHPSPATRPFSVMLKDEQLVLQPPIVKELPFSVTVKVAQQVRGANEKAALN
jgi:hypothetical protein